MRPKGWRLAWGSQEMSKHVRPYWLEISVELQKRRESPRSRRQKACESVAARVGIISGQRTCCRQHGIGPGSGEERRRGGGYATGKSIRHMSYCAHVCAGWGRRALRGTLAACSASAVFPRVGATPVGRALGCSRLRAPSGLCRAASRRSLVFLQHDIRDTACYHICSHFLAGADISPGPTLLCRATRYAAEDPGAVPS